MHQRLLPLLFPALLLGFSALPTGLTFGQEPRKHGAASARPFAPSRASECSQDVFEKKFGPQELALFSQEWERQTRVFPYVFSRSPAPLEVNSLSLFPVEREFTVSGEGSEAGETVTVWGYRYQAPKDSPFRLAVAESFLCSLDTQNGFLDSLKGLLANEKIFDQWEGFSKKSKTTPDEHKDPTDLARFKKMNELFKALEEFASEIKSSPAGKALLSAFFKQMISNEQRLSKTPPEALELHPDLKKLLKQIQESENSEELLNLTERLADLDGFDYWLHPQIATYVRKVIEDPNFSVNKNNFTPQQADDFSNRVLRALGQTEPDRSSLLDPRRSQGHIGVDSNGAGSVTVQSPESLFASDLSHFEKSLNGLSEAEKQAKRQNAAASITRAIHDYRETGALSPQHLAVLKGSETLLRTLDNKDTPVQDILNASPQESAALDRAERSVLTPVREDLEKRIPNNSFPISGGAILKVSKLPPVYQEIIRRIGKSMEKNDLHAIDAMASFMQTGDTTHLMSLIFSDRDALSSTLQTLSSKGMPPEVTGALERQANAHFGLKGSGRSNPEDFEYARRLLKKKIRELGNDPNQKEQRDSHLLALAIMDEMGLKGVTDRDNKGSTDSYTPEHIAGTLANENDAIEHACGDKKGFAKLECEEKVLKAARDFIGQHTGLPSSVRARLFDRFSKRDDDASKAQDYLKHMAERPLPRGSPLRTAYLFRPNSELASLASEEQTAEETQKQNPQNPKDKQLIEDARLLARHLIPFVETFTPEEYAELPDKKAVLSFIRCLQEKMASPNTLNHAAGISLIYQAATQEDPSLALSVLRAASDLLSCGDNIPKALSWGPFELSEAAKKAGEPLARKETLEYIDGKSGGGARDAQAEKKGLSLQLAQKLQDQYGIIYDPNDHSVLITQDSKLDAGVFDLLSQSEGLTIKYQGVDSEEATLFQNASSKESFLNALAAVGARFGAYPLQEGINIHSKGPHLWEDIRKLDGSNPDGVPTPTWFPISSNTLVRMIQREDGSLEAEFAPMSEWSTKAREQMEKIIEGRGANIEAQEAFSSWAHAGKVYGMNLGNVPVLFGGSVSASAEETALREEWNDYAQLVDSFRKFANIPIKGFRDRKGGEFRTAELGVMRELLDKESEAIAQFLTRAETIDFLAQTAVMIAGGAALSSLPAIQGLMKVAQGTGKAAAAARTALMVLKSQIHGAKTAATFQGVDLIGKGVGEGVADFFGSESKRLIEEKLEKARKGERWRKFETDPRTKNWGETDPNTGLPLDPKNRKEYLLAELEYQIERDLDQDHNGVPDEIQGLNQSPVTFAKKRDYWSRVINPDNFDHFASSSRFFRDLELARAVPMGPLRKIPGVAMAWEMAAAGLMGELEKTRDEVAREEEYRRKQNLPPLSLRERALTAFTEGGIEGARFSLSGGLSNLGLTRGARRPNAGNILLGSALFTAVDIGTRELVNQATGKPSEFEEQSDPDWSTSISKFFERHATTLYIGASISRGGLERAKAADYRKAGAKGGREGIRELVSRDRKRDLRGREMPMDEAARQREEEAIDAIMLSFSAEQLREASPQVRQEYFDLNQRQIERASEALSALTQLDSGLLSRDQKTKIVDNQVRLLELLRAGRWNNPSQVTELMREQDRIFSEINKSFEERRRVLSTSQQSPPLTASPEERRQFHEEKDAQMQQLTDASSLITSALPRLMTLRTMVEPALEVAAVSDPSSQLAQEYLSPEARKALQTYWGSAPVQRGFSELKRRASRFFSGEEVFGRITANDQKSAASLVEGAILSSQTSKEAQTELIQLLIQLDPERAERVWKKLNP